MLRGGLPESVHPLSAVLYESGRVRWSVGDDVASYWRSACKPFQLSVSLEHLPDELVASLSNDELAVGAASHNGEARHVEVVEGLLTRLGASASALQCGAHAPMHEPTARLVAEPSVLHSNCSGKHSFMLGACLHAGLPHDYRPREHPLQERIAARLDELAGHVHPHAVDGCSVPTFFAPLSAQARAFCRLAEAMAERDTSLARESILGRIGWAMHDSSWFSSGTGRLDYVVVTGASEPLTVKVGAEGLFCIALPKRRAALAIKSHTGNADALAVGVRAVLERQGIAISGDFPWERITNVRGLVVGERRATFR
jgi:L-asparaginase II